MIIATKASPSRKCLLVEPREMVWRPFDFGNDWTEIRLGGFISLCNITGVENNIDAANEDISFTGPVDRFFFGAKNNDGGLTIPGQTGCRFLGIGHHAETIRRQRDDGNFRTLVRFASAGNLRYISSRDTTVTSGSTIPSLNCGHNTAANASNYTGFSIVRIAVTNRNLATQSVVIQTCNAFEDLAVGTTYPISQLRTLMTAFANPVTASASIPWNDGVAALPLPDCWAIRNPFFNSYFRLFGMNVLRIA